MKGHQLLMLLLAICCFACKNKKTTDQQVEVSPIDPLEAALPHGAALPFAELSEQDKKTLANAKGRTVKEINLPSLKEMINQSKGMLHIYQFWKMDCPSCLALNEHLIKVQNELADKDFNLILINFDGMKKKDEINYYIREKGIGTELYTVPDDTNLSGFLSEYRWNGVLPAFLLINKDDGTNLFYQRNFLYEELLTIIQTVTL